MYVRVDLRKYFLAFSIYLFDEMMNEDSIVYVQRKRERESEESHVFNIKLDEKML